MSRAARRWLVLPVVFLLLGCPAHVGPPRLGGGPGGVPEGSGGDDPGADQATGASLCLDSRLDRPRAPIERGLREAEDEAARGLDVLAAVRASSPKMASELLLWPEMSGQADLALGSPLGVVTLELETLEEGVASAMRSIGRQLRRPNRYVFPVHADSEEGPLPVSSVSVVDKDGGWQVTTLGRRQLVESLFGDWLRARFETPNGEAGATAARGEPGDRAFLIAVPALYKLYLATCRGTGRRHRADRGVALAPVFDAGAFAGADDDLRALAEEEPRRPGRRGLGAPTLEDVLIDLGAKAESYVSPLAR